MELTGPASAQRIFFRAGHSSGVNGFHQREVP
jgi:hypothetical protein